MFHKSILLGVALLGIALLVISQDNTQVDVKDFVRLLNWRRRAFAIANNMPAMMEISWDEKLVATARKLPNEWYDDGRKGDTYRATFLWGYSDASEKFRAYNAWYRELRETNMAAINEVIKKDDPKQTDWEFFTPAQTKIGCTTKKGTGSAWVLCLVGPLNTRDSHLFTTGEPGSKCPSGTTNNDGLCK